MPRLSAIILILLLAVSCGRRNIPLNADNIATDIQEVNTPEPTPESAPLKKKSGTASTLDSLGYVNIGETDSRISVEIIYATPDNFVGEVLYEDLDEAYLLPEAAEKLSKAQDILETLHPEYKLLVYDAARPMSVQKKMWDAAVKGGKQYYVANPAKGGGLHNYGAAVDVTVTDENGKPLPMGTVYDFLGPEANTDKEEELVRTGKITRQEADNRLLLRKVMREAGFRTVKSEWWHFNLCSREEAVKKYPLINP